MKIQPNLIGNSSPHPSTDTDNRAKINFAAKIQSWSRFVIQQLHNETLREAPPRDASDASEAQHKEPSEAQPKGREKSKLGEGSKEVFSCKT